VESRRSSASQDILVLGIGNPLMGDDGAGIRLVERLAEADLPPYVRVEEAGLPGWGLPSFFEGQSSVILVDAVLMGAKPGSWRRFTPEEMQIVLEDEALSLHQPDLACGLALSEALEMLPEKLVLYGIEPCDTSPGAELSPEVSACLSEVLESILNELEKKTA